MSPVTGRFLMSAGLIAIALMPFGYTRASASGIPLQRQVSSSPAATSLQHATLDRTMLDRYCVTCHNQTLKTAGLTLEAMDLGKVGEAAEVWEKVVRKLHAGLMPPAGRPRPDKATVQRFVSSLESELDRAAAVMPNPGRTEPFHRLNRAEYRNAIRDLLALDLDVDGAALLPADDASYGFDNIASVQRMSPTLLEKYLLAAQKISRAAVGTPAPPLSRTIRLPVDYPQDDHVDGLPFGTRGGVLIHHTFPLDGEYSIRVQLARLVANTENIPGFDQPQLLEVSVDGEPLQVFTLPAVEPPSEDEKADLGSYKHDRRDLDGDWKVHFPARAGPHEIAVTFLNRTLALHESPVRPLLRPYPGGSPGAGLYTTRKGAYLRSVEIDGPFNASGPGDTPSRRRIFVCRQLTEGCAKTILSGLARRAYRRPVTEADLQALLTFYRDGRTQGGHEAGIERALRALLMSPEFLFRIERDPATIALNIPYRISDLELASRVSFFLWSSIPDDELLDVAIRGKLKEPVMLERQVRRMLADPRSEALVSNFAGQWLFLRNVPALAPDPKKDPDFDDNLRQAFRRETELFFDSIIREDRSVLELLTADYTFVNERLARHYGIPNVYGDHFRRVKLPDNNRRGLLGHGSILSVTSLSHRTSPVMRGKWILTNLLGTPPPDPPPDVPELPEETTPTGKVLTMRERNVAHRTNPVCASCHGIMEPLGFALGNFDFVGRWRNVDQTFTPIDASGVLLDGTKFDGVQGFRQALLNQPAGFMTTMTEKLLTYALGRGLEYYDMPAIRQIVRETAHEDGRFSSLVWGIVNSLPFQARKSALVAVSAAQ